jgi:hypothetical protein
VKDVRMYNSLFQNSSLVLLTKILSTVILFSYTKIAEDGCKKILGKCSSYILGNFEGGSVYIVQVDEESFSIM